jgi:hypothetical protein
VHTTHGLGPENLSSSPRHVVISIRQYTIGQLASTESLRLAHTQRRKVYKHISTSRQALWRHYWRLSTAIIDAKLLNRKRKPNKNLIKRINIMITKLSNKKSISIISHITKIYDHFNQCKSV